MNIHNVSLSVAILACLGLNACGGSSNKQGMVGPNPMQPSAQTLSTAQVVTLTQAQSETSDPIVVNEGAVTLTPANDDTSDPAPVN